MTLGKSINVNFQQISIADSLYVGTAKTDVLRAKHIIVSEECDPNQNWCPEGTSTRLSVGEWTYPNSKYEPTIPNINKVTINGVDVNKVLNLDMALKPYEKVLMTGWYY